MPRGVYDRSKAKKKSEGTSDAPKTEKKQRAPWGSKKAAKVAASSPTREIQFEALSLTELAQLRGAFSGPSNANTLIISKIDSLVVRQLDTLIGQVTASSTETNGTKKASAQAAAPVQAAAPIPAAAPFNPPVPPNQA